MCDITLKFLCDIIFESILLYYVIFLTYVLKNKFYEKKIWINLSSIKISLKDSGIVETDIEDNFLMFQHLDYRLRGNKSKTKKYLF